MTTTQSQNDDSMTDVDFNGLILGLSSAALYYIGHSEIEGETISKVNFDLAKQNIRIIEMLHDKTRGNLTSEEARLIEQILKDLRLKYNSAKKEVST